MCGIVGWISFKENINGSNNLNTYSVDYIDNDKYFKANDYEPNSDSYYIKKWLTSSKQASIMLC